LGVVKRNLTAFKEVFLFYRQGEEPKGSKNMEESLEGKTEAESTADPKEQDLSEVEALASEIGWREGGELDAKDYILKSRDIQDTMRDHIKTQKQQLNDLDSSVSELKIHNERVYHAEIKQKDAEIKALKKEKTEAIEEGDVEKVDELDEQIDGLKKEMVKPAPAPSNKDFDTWVEKNKWYMEDSEMADYADTIADNNKGAPFKRVAVLVESKVKEMFPDKFQTRKTIPASPVEGAGKKITSAKFTKADLTDSQKDIMSKFVRQGIMTEKAYIEDIGKTQGVA